jgi:hypothetical protein
VSVYELKSGERNLYTFDWEDDMPNMSPFPSISSVTYTITPSYSPQRLYAVQTSEDFTNYKSSVLLAGAVHGETYQVTAACTLSNGEVLKEGITIRGFA